MNIKLRYLAPLAVALLPLMASCLKDDPYETYEEWRVENTAYFDSIERGIPANGFEKVAPKWDPASAILMKWHNNRALTAGNLMPLDNSTVDVKYLLTNVKGDTIDSSYKLTANGDSIFRCQPTALITGFWIALTNMHVGDSVTTVIPWQAGYGAGGSGNILPYSTLIFQIKLDSIVALEKNP